MTAAELRAAIARDCPHRLPDYDRHLAGHEPTAAFLVLWHVEWRLSSGPLEEQIHNLYARAQASETREEARRYFEQVSRIRRQVRDEVLEEMGDA